MEIYLMYAEGVARSATRALEDHIAMCRVSGNATTPLGETYLQLIKEHLAASAALLKTITTETPIPKTEVK
jgi:hypothetical protein